MQALKTNLLDLLKQRRVTQYLIALWLVHIWGSIWYMAPGPDDGAFISQALGFIGFGDLGILYIDRFQGFFVNLPAYAFTQSLFYLLWSNLGLPIDFSTYKIFHLSVATGLIVVTVSIIRRTAEHNFELGNLRANLFLLMLPVTPFVIDVLSPRPEAFGLLAIASAILCFQIAEASTQRSTTILLLAAFLLGVSISTHPMFVVVGSGICLAFAFWLWRQRRYITIASCVVSAALPVTAMALWFLRHAPESIEMMLNHVGTHSPNVFDGFGSGFGVMLGYSTLQFSTHFSLMAQLFYAVCFGWLTIITVTSVWMLYSRFSYKLISDNFHIFMGFIVFILPFIYFSFSFRPKVQVFTMISYFFILSLMVMIGTPKRIRD